MTMDKLTDIDIHSRGASFVAYGMFGNGDIAVFPLKDGDAVDTFLYNETNINPDVKVSFS